MTRLKLSLILPGLMLPLLTPAAEVYRSVDESGQVIFSDTPPAGDKPAEAIELIPGPTDKALRDARARHEAVRTQLEKLQKEREHEAQIRAAKVREAQKALENAEAELAEARELKDSDRQSLASGRRMIKAEYFERVEQAEAAVEAAREQLRKARSGR